MSFPSADLHALRLRAHMLAQTRAFFAQRDVMEVQTPALSLAASSDPAIESIEARVRSLGDAALYLQTSPEFAMKRLLAGGSGDIYQICQVFRDDELGRWHQPEFTMLEWYRTGFDEHALMDEVEALLSELLHGRPGEPARVQRLSYDEAFTARLGVSTAAGHAAIAGALTDRGIDVPDALGFDSLLNLAFSAVVAPGFDRSVLSFVFDYPPGQAALAKIRPGDKPAAMRFEAFMGPVELANGFNELTDGAEQRKRFEADIEWRRQSGQRVAPIDEAFLDALAQGLPECSGVAVGFDRLVAIALGAASLAPAIAFSHGRTPVLSP